MIQLPRLRYDRIAWVLFLLMVAGLWYNAVSTRKSSDITRLEVTVHPLEGGNKLITEENVRNLLRKSFGSAIEKTQMSALEIDRMEQVLSEDPFVEKADVFVDQRNNLQVSIVQRNPVLRVMDLQGGNYYLDKSGSKMPVSNYFTARVLVATGKIPPHSPDFLSQKTGVLREVFLLAQKLREDPFFNPFIQQIHVSSNGDMMMAPLIGDQVIILGSTRRLDDKLEKLRIFYKNAMPYEGWRKYSTINLKYSGQVVCRK